MARNKRIPSNYFTNFINKHYVETSLLLLGEGK